MNKNYKFNSISIDTNDGVYDFLLGLRRDTTHLNLSNYPLKTLGNDFCEGEGLLEKITLPETLEAIGNTSYDNTLLNCYNLKEINLPKSLQKINCSSFLKYSKIYNDNSNWIDECFCYDGWLISISSTCTEAVVPSGVKLASNALKYSSNITKLELSAGIKTVPSDFIYSCENLKTLILNNDLERIEDNSFYCQNLTEIKLPESITYMGMYAIRSKIQKVYITNLKKFCEIERGSSIFYGTTGFDIYLNNSLLKNVSFPSDLTIIKPHTFFDSNIESLTIPKSVKEIGAVACNYCKKLTNIIYQGTVSEWKSIIKPYKWTAYAPVTYIQCTDGQVQL